MNQRHETDTRCFHTVLSSRGETVQYNSVYVIITLGQACPKHGWPLRNSRVALQITDVRIFGILFSLPGNIWRTVLKHEIKIRWNFNDPAGKLGHAGSEEQCEGRIFWRLKMEERDYLNLKHLWGLRSDCGRTDVKKCGFRSLWGQSRLHNMNPRRWFWGSVVLNIHC